MKLATLWGPHGLKQVVKVGSPGAAHLQSQGWGLTAGSYRPSQSFNSPSPVVPPAAYPIGQHKQDALVRHFQTLLQTSPGIGAGAVDLAQGLTPKTQLDPSAIAVQQQNTMQDFNKRQQEMSSLGLGNGGSPILDPVKQQQLLLLKQQQAARMGSKNSALLGL